MNKISFRKVNVGQVGMVDIDIPIISLGEGESKVVVLCGVHGDERSGLFIVDSLINELKDSTLLHGSIDFVLAANPLAQALGQRESPNDKLDLNRVFPGNSETDFTKRLSAKLFELCADASAVIDLHTFQDISPVVAIFMNSGTEKVKKDTLDLLKAFNPEIVWKLNFKSAEEIMLSGALGPILAERGIPNFAVEMPESFHITKVQIDRVKQGVVRVLKSLRIIESFVNTSNDLAVFNRIRVRVDKSGLFIPSKDVLKPVKKGDEIGTFVTLPDFNHEPVLSPCDGVLLVVHQRNLVSTSDEVVSIGVKPVEF